MKVTAAFAKRVNYLLIKKNMTRYRLCNDIAMHTNTMFGIMHAKYSDIGFKNIILICRGLGVTVTEFMDDPIFESPDLEID